MSTMPEKTNRSNMSDPTYGNYEVSKEREERARVSSGPAYERRRRGLAKLTQLASLMLGTLELALAFRVLFKLIDANSANPFAHLLYQVTQPFAAPFLSLVATPSYGGIVFEISTLIGMAVYAVLYWLFIRLMWVIFNPAKAVDPDKYEPDL